MGKVKDAAKNNWKEILIGLLTTAAAGYVGVSQSDSMARVETVAVQSASKEYVDEKFHALENQQNRMMDTLEKIDDRVYEIHKRMRR